MMHASECRAFAEKCRAMAKAARDESQKTELIQLADQWERIANTSQRQNFLRLIRMVRKNPTTGARRH